ncbi:MAG: molybdate ABC transporter substrate-binding protein [Pseudomonadota bacterium]
MVRALLSLVMVLLMAQTALAGSLTAAAGAGYKRMLEKVFSVYQEKTGRQVDQIYGHMGQVTMQAKAGGKIAVIVGEEGFLAASGLEFDSMIPVGRGVLVLAYPKGSSLQSAEDLTRPEIARVAAPDGKQAIYGKAALQFLKNAGLFPKVEKKMLIVSTVPQVSSYLMSGEVDAGFINLTDAINIKDKIGGYIVVDQEKYDPLRLVVAVLKGWQHQPDCKDFLDFITNDPQVKAILTASGL